MLDYIDIPHKKVENTLYAVIAVNGRNKLNEIRKKSAVFWVSYMLLKSERVSRVRAWAVMSRFNDYPSTEC